VKKCHFPPSLPILILHQLESTVQLVLVVSIAASCTIYSIQKEIYFLACEHVSIAVPCAMTCAVLIITLIGNGSGGHFVSKKAE
jgi:hypothetical protein